MHFDQSLWVCIVHCRAHFDMHVAGCKPPVQRSERPSEFHQASWMALFLMIKRGRASCALKSMSFESSQMSISAMDIRQGRSFQSRIRHSSWPVTSGGNSFWIAFSPKSCRKALVPGGPSGGGISGADFCRSEGMS